MKSHLALLIGIAFSVGPSAAVADSIWMHNGSVVRLSAQSSDRTFTYVTPKSGLPVPPGTVLFHGTKIGNLYSGTTRLFSSRCGAIDYAVSGSVSVDGLSITLTGKRPQRGSDCDITGYVPETLIFTLSQSTLPEPPSDRDLAQSWVGENTLTAKVLSNPTEAFRIAALANDSSFNTDPGDDNLSMMLRTCSYALPTGDPFLVDFGELVSYDVRVAAALSKAGYPTSIWRNDLNRLVADRLSEMVGLKRTGNYGELHTLFNSDLPNERLLVDDLARYRDHGHKTLPNPRGGDIDIYCGGDFIGGVKIVSRPPGASIRIIQAFSYDLCGASGIAPLSDSCNDWISVSDDSEIPEGTYYYRAVWPDGHDNCDQTELVFDGEHEDEIQTVTLSDSGRACK